MSTPQSAAQPGAGATSGPRLNAIGIVVADMSAAITFYQRLGLTFPPESTTETHVSAPLGGGVELMFDTEEMIRDLYPDWTGDVGERVSLAVQLPSAAEVDRLYAELAADGFGNREPWDAVWGQRYACLRDPDGTSVDLYAELPQSTDTPAPGDTAE